MFFTATNPDINPKFIFQDTPTNKIKFLSVVDLHGKNLQTH